MSDGEEIDDKPLTPRGERRVFLFVAVFLFPILSVVIVGVFSRCVARPGAG